MENEKWQMENDSGRLRRDSLGSGDFHWVSSLNPGAGAAGNIHEVGEVMLFENARSRAGTITARANHRRWFC